jgi:tRNA-dihydrouridine synthase 3
MVIRIDKRFVKENTPFGATVCAQARWRMEYGGFLAHMVGRGALIKPWIFQEVKEGRELSLDATDRLEIYCRLVSYMKEHFGDDEKGRRKAFYFLPWHFDFLCRYRSALWAI